MGSWYVQVCGMGSVVLMDEKAGLDGASVVLWEVHVSKPSTHVLTPPKLGALREVARDNIFVKKCALS